VVQSIQTLPSAEIIYVHFTGLICTLFSFTLPANLPTEIFTCGRKERIEAACQLESCESKKPARIQSQQKLGGPPAISVLVMVLQST